MIYKKNIYPFLGLMFFILTVLSCNVNAKKDGKKYVHEIKSVEEFNKILKKSGNTLLIIDFHANWCAPCRTLGPRLEKIAKKNKKNVSFYKINVDEIRELAVKYKVRAIPYVVYIKNQKIVTTLIGLNPEKEYIKNVDKFSEPKKKRK